MKASDYLQKSSALFDENRLLKFAFVVMATAFCFNSLMVYRAVTYQRTILLPPKLSGEVEFAKGRPSERYIRDMTRTIAGLAGTWSPSTVRENFEELLYYFHPETYPQAAKRWYSLASRAEEGLVSSVFYLEKISFDDQLIELFGRLVQHTGDTLLEQTSRTYLVEYRLEDGRFFINAIREKGTKPSTNREEDNK